MNPLNSLSVGPCPGLIRRHPSGRRDRPGAIAAAQRHKLPLPRHISGVLHRDDLVVTACDLAREEFGDLAAVRRSVPAPVRAGTRPASTRHWTR